MNWMKKYFRSDNHKNKIFQNQSQIHDLGVLLKNKKRLAIGVKQCLNLPLSYNYMK